MMKLICLAFFIAAASATGSGRASISKILPRGVVSPVDRCGGDGIPLELRVTACTGAPPCNIIPGTFYTIEGDFIPSADSDNAHFKLTARTTSGSEIPVSDGSIGVIRAGLSYTASQAIQVSSALAGQTVVVQVQVYDQASGRVEICVEAPMNIVG